MLEYFAHLDPDDPPDDLVLATANVPDDLVRERVQTSELPANWRDTYAPPELLRLGDGFVHRGDHVLLLVPSALAPNEYNWLINPQHADFRRIAVRNPEPLSYDPRMFRKRSASRPHRAD
jgi:RES domain-containing protein